MPTAISICSNASLMLGGKTINSFDDKNDRATLCANLWPTVMGYVLSAHPWKCATKRLLLNPDAEAPAFDWTYQFTLPPDYLRIRSVGEAGAEDPYHIENGKIMADTAPLKLRYVWRNDNPSTWTDLLVMAATLAMRQVLAYPITQSTSLEQLIDQAIAPTLQRARAIDGQDEPPETVGDYPILASRFGGRCSPWG